MPGRAKPAVLPALGLLLLLAASCAAEDDNPLQLHDSGARTLQLSNAIAAFLIEHGYGYEVELAPGSSTALQQRLPAGEIDLALEVWRQDALAWYEGETEAGRIEDLGPTYAQGERFLMIPRSTAEELEIRTVFDLRDHWQDFLDPRDASKGVIINCVAGSQCAELNRVKLEAYGLAGYFNLISPSSHESLDATLERAGQFEVSIAGFYSAPSRLIARYEWSVLEEPPYSRGCQLALEAAAFGAGPAPARGCAYERVPVNALAHAGLRERAPEVVAMIERMQLGSEPLIEALEWAAEQGLRDDWEPAAIFYLERERDGWREWLTPEASRRVGAVLANLSAAAR